MGSDTDRPGTVRLMTLDEWMESASAALGIGLDDLGGDLASVRTQLLDLARDAAHGVARPAAPLTTFLVGVALGQGSTRRTGTDLADAIHTVRGLIPEIEPREEPVG